MLLIPDISHHNTLTDSAMHDMKAAGYPVVINKATQGGSNIDATFADRLARERSVGLIPGSYAFLDPNPSGIKQAQHYLKVAHLQKGDLQPIVDAESLGLTRTTFLQAMYTLEGQGYRPILYSYKSFWESLGSPVRWPLWIAGYTKSMPSLPASAEVFAWQYTDKEQVAGVVGPCDCSKFFGTLLDLKKYLI